MLVPCPLRGLPLCPGLRDKTWSRQPGRWAACALYEDMAELTATLQAGSLAWGLTLRILYSAPWSGVGRPQARPPV